jgi:hypothetical protein
MSAVQAQPPRAPGIDLLIGSPEEVREQAAALTHVPVATLARVGLTRDRLRELIAVLQASLDEHDRILGG